MTLYHLEIIIITQATLNPSMMLLLLLLLLLMIMTTMYVKQLTGVG